VPSLTVGSLFSGIGGIDLGLERAGHRVLWQSEIDNYACRVLKKHWPEIPNLGDVKKINWSEVPNVDIIAGGYPCQPFSTAGKRKGKEDPRHLWPYVLDAIRTIRPRYALMENVRGHLTLGFGDVLADLAGCGYSAEWQIISAASVGAPHRRDRLFFVAYPDGERSHRTEVNSTEGRQSALVDVAGRGEAVAYSEIFGGDGRRNQSDSETASGRSALQSKTRGSGGIMAETPRQSRKSRRNTWHGQSGKHGSSSDAAGDNGFGSRATDDFGEWQTEPGMGRVAHGIPARVDKLRGLGNAVVPQVAELVGRLISQHADN
jgi:DNA (cytosine-5)-methyltransferase 1